MNKLDNSFDKIDIKMLSYMDVVLPYTHTKIITSLKGAHRREFAYMKKRFLSDFERQQSATNNLGNRECRFTKE